MIRCNLAILLAERALKISTVSKETGISRTTLTALSSNRSEGIQFDTVNTLCGYLKVRPDMLISFIPLEIKAVKFRQEDIVAENLNVSYSEMAGFRCILGAYDTSEICFLRANVRAEVEYDDANSSNILTVNLEFSFPTDTESAFRNEFLIRVFSQIPMPFLKDIEKEFSFVHAAVSEPIRKLPSKYVSTKINYKISWPIELMQIN